MDEIVITPERPMFNELRPFISLDYAIGREVSHGDPSNATELWRERLRTFFPDIFARATSIFFYQDDPYGERSDVAILYQDYDGFYVLANFHIDKGSNTASIRNTTDKPVIKE